MTDQTPEDPNESGKAGETRIGPGLVIGVALGIGVWFALNSIAIGAGVGIAIGLAVGSGKIVPFRKKKDS